MLAPTFALAALITSLVALGPLSTDFYLPALPAIVAALSTDVASAQLTLSVFLVGFGAGQLIYGPLSDRFGRRPVLLGGMVVFCIASAICALVPAIEWLIAARFLQALGACAGPVLGRAIVRDVYGPHDSARVLSYVAAAMALAPLVGPLLGGSLTVWFGWRATFVFLTVFSLVQTVVVWRALGESNRHLDPEATRPRRIVANYRSLLADRLYRGVLLCNSFAYASMFAFISGAAFVFIDLFGFSPQAMGVAFGLMVSGYMLGTAISGRFSRRAGAARLLGAGVATGSLGGLAMLALLAAGVLHPLAVIVPMWFNSAAVGLIMPNATAIGLAPYARMAGAAASLMGFVQMSLSAVSGIVVGHSLAASPLPMALVVAGCMLASLVVHVLMVRPALARAAG